MVKAAKPVNVVTRATGVRYALPSRVSVASVKFARRGEGVNLHYDDAGHPARVSIASVKYTRRGEGVNLHYDDAGHPARVSIARVMWRPSLARRPPSQLRPLGRPASPGPLWRPSF